MKWREVVLNMAIWLRGKGIFGAWRGVKMEVREGELSGSGGNRRGRFRAGEGDINNRRELGRSMVVDVADKTVGKFSGWMGNQRSSEDATVSRISRCLVFMELGKMSLAWRRIPITSYVTPSHVIQ